jgi:hypothetical protein
VSATDALPYDGVRLDVADGVSVVVGRKGAGLTNLSDLVRLMVRTPRAVATGDLADLHRARSRASRWANTLALS